MGQSGNVEVIALTGDCHRRHQVGIWLKPLAFGLAVTVIPVAEGMAPPKRLFMAPISVLRGMVRRAAAPLVALLVAAIGVANLMTANVAARTRQIAIAYDANDEDVRSAFAAYGQVSSAAVIKR